jgi:serine/threonine protein kinase
LPDSSLDRLTLALADRYRIERELGAGGMATVYLARDLRHDRMVAIKVLRPELAAVIGAERFLSEIKTTANLQHPHILPLYDSGRTGGPAERRSDGTSEGLTAQPPDRLPDFLFYVMPYIQGETLREKLDRETQLGVAEAVKLATEVADALEYAHQQGVIHRDIKPENILLHGGRPMVADFGIALAVSHAAGERLTETGLSLGTPHYMSPEQATAAKDLTNRSDVYSLGAMLYEMLVGDPPHTAASVQQVIAKIVTEEAAPVTRARKSVPPHVAAAVAKTLEKLPADRFATAKEFADALANPAFTTARSAAALAGPPSRRHALLALATTTVLATALAAWGWLRPPSRLPSQPPSRLAVPAPNLGGSATGLQRQLALTPDGSTLIYTAITPDGSNRTMRRPLDATEPTVLPGVVEFVAEYIMSPDGSEFIASDFARRQAYMVSGGSSKPLPAGVGAPMMGAWARDGSVWISDLNLDQGIARLGSDGALTRPFGASTYDVLVMQVLPDDRTALAVRMVQGNANGPAELLDLRTGATTPLMDIAMVAIYYTMGHLVYCLPDGTVEAVPFDPAARRLEGAAVQIARGVSVTGAARCQLAVADNGTVAYIPEETRSLALVDRSGSSRLATDERRNFHDPRFSPDGRRIAMDFNTPDGRDVWVLELDAGVMTRATFDRDGHDATWMPDGRSLTYSSLRGGEFGIYRTRPGSAEPPESLIVTPQLSFTGLWLRDGDTLVSVTAPTGAVFADIVLLGHGGQGPIEPVVATRFDESYPALSRDGRWLAYVSNQSGRAEVYLRALLGGGEQVRVSLDGGSEPVFGPDGRELFYRTASELLVAELAHEPALAVTSRRVLFDVSDIATGFPHSNYDLSPDGRTFVMVRLNPSSRIMVIQNLPALVRKLSGQNGGR